MAIDLVVSALFSVSFRIKNYSLRVKGCRKKKHEEEEEKKNIREKEKQNKTTLKQQQTQRREREMKNIETEWERNAIHETKWKHRWVHWLLVAIMSTYNRLKHANSTLRMCNRSMACKYFFQHQFHDPCDFIGRTRSLHFIGSLMNRARATSILISAILAEYKFTVLD